MQIDNQWGYKIGDIINDMMITGYSKDTGGNTTYAIKCIKCGSTKNIRPSRFNPNGLGTFHSKYCKNYLEYDYPIGSSLGDLVIMGYDRESEKENLLICKCMKCGIERTVGICAIHNHPTIIYHEHCDYGLGSAHLALYRKWKGFRNRINNPNNKAYHNYGGRGLTCDYDKFVDFFNDMSESFYQHVAMYGLEETTLDRINNNLGYIRGNLRWATNAEQTYNRRNMKTFIAYSPVKPDGTVDVYKSNNIKKFAMKHGIKPNIIDDRLHGYVQKYNPAKWWFSYEDHLFYFNGELNIIDEMY